MTGLWKDKIQFRDVLALVVTLCYFGASFAGIELPAEITGAYITVLAFYFSRRTANGKV